MHHSRSNRVRAHLQVGDVNGGGDQLIEYLVDLSLEELLLLLFVDALSDLELSCLKKLLGGVYLKHLVKFFPLLKMRLQLLVILEKIEG